MTKIINSYSENGRIYFILLESETFPESEFCESGDEKSGIFYLHDNKYLMIIKDGYDNKSDYDASLILLHISKIKKSNGWKLLEFICKFHPHNSDFMQQVILHIPLIVNQQFQRDNYPFAARIKKYVGIKDSIVIFLEMEDQVDLLQSISINLLDGRNIIIRNNIFKVEEDKFIIFINENHRYFPLKIAFHLKSGLILNLSCLYQYENARDIRQYLLEFAKNPSDNAIERCYLPITSKLQQDIYNEPRIKSIHQFNRANQNPKISIIIPLYKNYDFLRLQIAKFFADEFIRNNCEIIYILDAEQDQEMITNFIAEYSEFLDVPIKLIIHKKNFGYAVSCNDGAKYAAASRLLFLNSDVIPKESGWANKMQLYYDYNNIGILGVKLLFEDDLIQHAGIYFVKNHDGMIVGAHLHEGMSNDFAIDNRRIDAVTGACIMVDKKIFDELNGFSINYIIGDFEDIDICLRAKEFGYQNHYMGEISLYHFERQSMNSNPLCNNISWKINRARFNLAWREILDDKIFSDRAS